ncbi:DEAD/DEAH box helicase family protein [Desulfatibacillum aliphaticivorans]|uniref:DEAD/DEAH box helicase family protein n=1 Tax=Desulfatibacillum aliphaticivorans TaxID=218208 RepID=UPI0003FC444B|nr:DEAD/DEAH box helicase family protein [Desulfatibacillum aliphaticivorans]
MLNREAQRWLGSAQAKDLPLSKKINALTGYFEDQLTDDEFYSLSLDDQQRVRHNFVAQNMAPYAPKAADRGLIGDMASASASGLVGAYEMTGRVLRGVDRMVGDDPIDEGMGRLGGAMVRQAQDATWKHDFLRPSKQAESGLRRWLYEGLQSVVQSVTAQGPATAAGAAAGAAAGGIGAPVGAIAGYALSGGTLYGVAAWDEFLEQADEMGIVRSVSEKAALKHALAEGGFEFATDLLEAVTAGLAKPVMAPGKQVLKTGVKGLLRRSWAQTLSRVAGTAAVEAGGEMATAGVQANIARDAGMGDMSFWDAAKQAFGPSTTAGLIFGVIGAGGNALQRGRIGSLLQDGQADPRARMQAAKHVSEAIKDIDPVLAKVWSQTSTQAITNGESISLDEEIQAKPMQDQGMASGPVEAGAAGKAPGVRNEALEAQRATREAEEAKVDAVHGQVIDLVKARRQAEKQAKAQADAQAQAQAEEQARMKQETMDALRQEDQALDGETMAGTLAELAGKLSPGQVAAVGDRVRELGSRDKVSKEYPDPSNVVDQYANGLALMLFPEAEVKMASSPEPPEEGGQAQPESAAAPGAGLVGSGRVMDMDPREIIADPDRFQYKRGMGQGGVNSKLKGIKKFDPNLAGLVTVWKDPEDGKVYVINGHHRLELAQRTGAESITVRFSDAETAEGAMVAGALQNIAEGQGSPEDAATIFRKLNIDKEALQEKFNISLKGKIAREGMALAQLSDFLFGQVKSGDLPRPWGVAIGNGLPGDDAAQLDLVRLLAKERKKRGNISQGFVEQLINVVKGAPTVETEQQSLFGAEMIRESLATEKAEILDYTLKRLANDKRLFGVVGKKASADRLSEAGNVIDVEASKDIAEQAAQVIDIINRLAHSKGTVSDLLNQAARELHDAGSNKERSAVKDRFYQAVSDAVPEIVQGRDPKGDTGRLGKPSDSPDSDQSGLAPSQGQQDLFSQPQTKPEKPPETAAQAEKKTASPPEKVKKPKNLAEVITGVSKKPKQTRNQPATVTENLTVEESKQIPGYGESNTVFTRDAAEEARKLLRKKLNQVSMGLDPELVQAGITLAGYHIEAGARSFAAYSKAMLQDLGEAAKPHLRSWYEAVRYYPGFDAQGMTEAKDIEEEPTGGKENAERGGGDLERNSGDAKAEDQVGPEVVQDGSGPGDGGLREGRQGPGKGRERSNDDSGVPGREAAASGKGRDQQVSGEQAGAGERPAGSEHGERSGDSGLEGVFFESVSAEAVGKSSSQSPAGIDKAAAQKAAQKVAVKPGNQENADQSLPFLTTGQRQDVVFAERRFANVDGHGVLFTNGTGTGKTAVGLGVAKRYERQSRDNILIAVPSDQVANGWIEFARNLHLDVKQLSDTRDNGGKGIVVTTYANLGVNASLVKRDWDLVIADEAHYLSQNKSGQRTNALNAVRALTLHSRGAHERYSRMYAKEIERAEILSKMDPQAIKDSEIEELESLSDQLADWRDQVMEEVEKAQQGGRPKLLMLSATPFAYEKSVDMAEGYLFSYPESDGYSYNAPGPYEAFMMQHFGYRMRYNKLTEPEAEVDRGLMQRQFNAFLKKEKVLSGRMLEVDFDYDRKFVLAESGIGTDIDEGLQWLWENKRYTAIHQLVMEQFDHLSRRYLLEAIKAQEVIPHIRAHMDLGRKVVVFHDFKKGGGFNPFNLSGHLKSREIVKIPDGGSLPLGDLVAEFAEKRADLWNLPIASMKSPIQTLTWEFGDELAIFNGDVPKAKRRQAVADFQDDNGKAQVILVQSAAGKEGISLHDTTGRHPRVLFNLGLPTQPTTAIQQEGRIYRVGQASNAMFRYLNTGTNWERFAFATTIAQRTSTAENLALGEQARALRDAFINGFENSDVYAAGFEGEGTGGKEQDAAANAALTEWDRAVSMYYANQKKTSRTKAAEGKDYFATPEPLGLKMVEWADIRPGDRVLEPSAGHGAIARWFPESANVTVVEPSRELSSRLRMVTEGRILEHRFEDLNIINKYDAIVMNPPFGSGGKTAVDHIAKAARHLNPGGRIAAIIPKGPAADKKFDKWYESDEAKGLFVVGEITLPSVTFERAGTRVNARIVIIDKEASKDQQPSSQASRDYSDAKTIKEFFERIENGTIPDRVRPRQDARPESAGEGEVEGETYVTDAPEVVHVTRKGKELRGVIAKDLSEEQAREIDKYTWKKQGGYFIRMKHVRRPDREEEPRQAAGGAQYATGRAPGEPVTLDQVRKHFPGADAGISTDGGVWVKYPGMDSLTIRAVDHISADEAAFTLGRGRSLESGEMIAGQYQDFEILLQRDIADQWTLAHEKFHFLEDVGLVSAKDRGVLSREIRSQVEAGNWKSENSGDVGGPEDRAVWVTEQLRQREFDRFSSPVRSVLQKIADFIDGLANLFVRTSRGVVRDLEGDRFLGKPAPAGEKTGHVRYAAVKQPGSAFLTWEMEQNRSFANRIFEQRDQAVHQVQLRVQELQKKVQELAGEKSRRKHALGFAYDKKLKRSRESDLLDQAMMVWRDIQGHPDKIAEFRAWAEKALKAPETSREGRIAIREQLGLLNRVEALTDEQKALADEIGALFEEAYTVAEANGVVKSWRDNYVRRIWKFKDKFKDSVSASGTGTSGFQTFTTARMGRKLDTILDGWMEGYELGVKGLTNSYGSYMTELESILANKDFIRSGYYLRDLEGGRLFDTRKRKGYAELDAPGFNVWEWAGQVGSDIGPQGAVSLFVSDYGRKFFFSPIERVPETFAVYKSKDSTRAYRVFLSEDDAQEFAARKQCDRIERRPPKDIAESWEQRRLYAPAELARMINKMTTGDRLFWDTPGLKALSRLNQALKSWILLSSFFHHMAGARSWMFGVQHGWRKTTETVDGDDVKTGGWNPVSAYKMGLRKIEERHPLITLGIKNGLTLGEIQDWGEGQLRDERGLAEELLRKLGLEKASKVMGGMGYARERFADSLFKKFFAGLKAEAFVIEFVHELQKTQDRHVKQGIKGGVDENAVAERVARLINADFGGLHLKRMGRNPTLQNISRMALLAPDWTESNFRTVTGMIPGLNKWINRIIGDIPGPKGMDSIYRRFWGRIALRVALATIMAQLLLNGPDDTEEFWKEQAGTERFKKFRWTEVDITRLYEMLGIETEGRKTFSIGGHFFDPLKLIDPPRLIKGKASPLGRAGEAVMTGTDWAERPFTGLGEFIATGKTRKDSPFDEKKGFWNRLPATVVNQVTNMQPVQVGYMIRYFAGEEDGLSALMLSAGASIHTAWAPRERMPVTRAESKEDQVYEALEDLADKEMLRLGPPSGRITVGGVPYKMSREQYLDYLERSSSLARSRITELMATARWNRMSDEAKAAAVEKIIKSARSKVRGKMKKSHT